MAMSAVEIAAAQGLASEVATVLGHGRISMMLMLVVTEVLRLCIAFVPAIACHCCPGELERQQGEQSDGKPTAHMAESSSYSVWGERVGPIRYRTSLHFGTHARNLSAEDSSPLRLRASEPKFGRCIS